MIVESCREYGVPVGIGLLTAAALLYQRSVARGARTAANMGCVGTELRTRTGSVGPPQPPEQPTVGPTTMIAPATTSASKTDPATRGFVDMLFFRPVSSGARVSSASLA